MPHNSHTKSKKKKNSSKTLRRKKKLLSVIEILEMAGFIEFIATYVNANVMLTKRLKQLVPNAWLEAKEKNTCIAFFLTHPLNIMFMTIYLSFKGFIWLYEILAYGTCVCLFIQPASKIVFHGVVIIHLKQILKYIFGVEISKIIKQSENEIL